MRNIDLKVRVSEWADLIMGFEVGVNEWFGVECLCFVWRE